jgi:hypothetical protein
VASVAARISTLADRLLLLPALGARISLAHAPALVVPSYAPKSGSPCDSFGCYHGWAVGQDYRKRGVRGFDAHKRIRGRKRHILVDTLIDLIPIRDLAFGRSAIVPPNVNLAVISTTSAEKAINHTTVNAAQLRSAGLSYGRRTLRALGVNHASWNLGPASTLTWAGANSVV